MKTSVSTLLLAVGSAVGLTALRPEAAPRQEKQDPAPVYDEQADASKDIAAALARAKENNRRVLIQWGANWCAWCVKLDRCFKDDGGVRRKLLYEYDLVHVDVGRFDKSMDLVAKYGAGLQETGIPYLTVLDAGGEVLANRETGSFEEGGKHDPKKVLAFLTEHQPEYWKAPDLLKSALHAARKSETRLLVTFGAPW